MTQKELVVFNDGTRGNWFASVLNTENGRNWTDRFKKKNPLLKVTKRFRHSNRRLACELAGKKYITYSENEVHAKVAERFVLYLSKNNRKNKLIQVGEFLDGDNFGFYRVADTWFNNSKRLIRVSYYGGSFTAKWSDKTNSWRKTT